MILGLHHTALATRDIERLSAFYIAHFGLKKIVDDSWANAPALDEIVGLRNSAARFMLLSAGNQVLELLEFASPVSKPGDTERPVSDCGFTHVCFAVQDIMAEYERLSAAGMKFTAPPIISGDLPLCATYGRDPDGNVVELLEIRAAHGFDYQPTTPNWRKA
jgi:catechol 2,3-dioxygenase-like lactoylglutathione lyase family enzyme